MERFHLTRRREFLDDAEPFTSLDLAQAALDAWVSQYNTARPHQSLAMAYPADRFRPVPAEQRPLLPLRLPVVLPYRGRPVEFDRLVPTCGNMTVAGRQFWLGPARAGIVVTLGAARGRVRALRKAATTARASPLSRR